MVDDGRRRRWPEAAGVVGARIADGAAHSFENPWSRARPNIAASGCGKKKLAQG